jgi:hypothetical protein
MEKNQIDQYDMVLATENHLNVNVNLWQNNIPITATKSVLSSKITELAGEIAIQIHNSTGIAEDKAVIRKKLEEQTFYIASACKSYAGAIGNKELTKTCDQSPSELMQAKEVELIGICDDVLQVVQNNLGGLSNYGITENVLNDFQMTKSAFLNIKSNPKEAISKRAAATLKISKLLPEILDVISSRLDNDMVLMSMSQPKFVEVYKFVRGIDNSPTNALSLTITVLDETTNTPISNVNIEIIGQGISRKSSERGYNRVQNLTEGAHELKLSHPDYETLTVPFTVVATETTELVLNLRKALVMST